MLAGIATPGNKACIRYPQDTVGEDTQLELVKMEAWAGKYAILNQKMAYFGTSSGSVLCHGYCHTGTELSSYVLKLSECVQKRFCEVLQALDCVKWTAGSRDMRFCVKTVPIQYRLKKGLILLNADKISEKANREDHMIS